MHVFAPRMALQGFFSHCDKLISIAFSMLGVDLTVDKQLQRGTTWDTPLTEYNHGKENEEEKYQEEEKS